MDDKFCLYLGTGDDGDTRGPARDYPSFENRCFAVDRVAPSVDELARDQLLLADQATYCLGSTHRFCPRYQILHGDEIPLVPADGTGMEDETGAGDEAAPYVDPSLLDELAYDIEADRAEGGSGLGLLAGVASLLLVILLCGGSVAAYAGWQMVDRGLISLGNRLVDAEETPEDDPVFLLVTATPQPLAVQSTLATPTWTPTPTFEFPEAVTPTPPAAAADGSGVLVITTPTPAPAAASTSEESAPDDAPSDPALATAVANPVVVSEPGEGPATPTRRPTPAFVVPTSTPAEAQIVVATPTPAPTYPTPTVNFGTAHKTLPPGECTILYWDVENARAVYLDNEGVFGQGERRVCLREIPQTYTLAVLSQNEVQTEYTTTVEIRFPTATPTMTPTETPVLTPTPTWTPVGTPQPPSAPPSYGVALVVDGGNQKQCAAGQPCEAVVQVQNSGSLADEMHVDLANESPWPAQICHTDGVCAETSLAIGVGPGEQRPLTLRVQVPADATAQSFHFRLVASSGNSNRTVQSEPVTVQVVVP